MKIMAVCVVSVGLFSAGLMGINNAAFAAATSGATPLPQAALQTAEAPAVAYTPQAEQQEAKTFVPPSITLQLETHPDHPIPATAMNVEEAAQIGARYIWDTFGVNIDGMYVNMFYAAQPSMSRTWWSGSVGLSPETGNFGASVGTSYFFTIDAVTGMRISITSIDNDAYQKAVDSSAIAVYIEADGLDTLQPDSPAVMVRGEAPAVFREWYDMDFEERIAALGLTHEEMDAYKQSAVNLAQIHFNHSTVVDVRWGDALNPGDVGLQAIMRKDEGGNETLQLESLTVTVTDATGREAIITIPASLSLYNNIYIGTSHNDFIPGFHLEVPGLG